MLAPGLWSSGTTYSVSSVLVGGGRSSFLVCERGIGATCALGTVLGAAEVMLMHFGVGNTSVEHTHTNIKSCVLAAEPETICNSGIPLTDASVVGLRWHVGMKTVLRLFNEEFNYIV